MQTLDYKITRRMGKRLVYLYVLEESNDSLLEHKAIETLKNRGMNEQQAKDHLRSLEFISTRGGPMNTLDFIIMGLATWRLASLFANEAGPFYIFKHLRRRCKELCRCNKLARRFHLHELIECEWCNSVWFGGLLALLWAWDERITILACLPLALSTVTILIKLTFIHPPERK